MDCENGDLCPVIIGTVLELLTWREERSLRVSFLAVQVIFVCVYITNYLHFFTMFFKFLTP